MSHDVTRRACPCGTGRPLAACCGVYHDNVHKPPTAEALMRSRYSAFVLRDADYLLATWAPETRPRRLDLRADATEWLGLQLLGTEAGGETDEQGRVEFVARFRTGGVAQELHEHSRFRREGEQWLYIDGTTSTRRAPPQVPATAAAQIGRNDPCPCGSGLKFKRCCGG
jgi:SEC-C motif-containing protein